VCVCVLVYACVCCTCVLHGSSMHNRTLRRPRLSDVGCWMAVCVCVCVCVGHDRACTACAHGLLHVRCRCRASCRVCDCWRGVHAGRGLMQGWCQTLPRVTHTHTLTLAGVNGAGSCVSRVQVWRRVWCARSGRRACVGWLAPEGFSLRARCCALAAEHMLMQQVPFWPWQQVCWQLQGGDDCCAGCGLWLPRVEHATAVTSLHMVCV
jgi:hypothetical protein